MSKACPSLWDVADIVSAEREIPEHFFGPPCNHSEQLRIIAYCRNGCRATSWGNLINAFFFAKN